MGSLLVVEDVKAWASTPIPNTEVVSAQEYLTNPRFLGLKRVRVCNLCRSNGYQTVGYYVSLLASARGHRPLPSVTTLQDLKISSILKIASSELQEKVQKLLGSLKGDKFVLSIYFGRNLAAKYDRLCQAIFNHFPAPFLRAEFELEGTWRLVSVKPISARDIPESHMWFVAEQAARFFAHGHSKTVKQPRYTMAILVDPDETDAPSDEKALQRFARAAAKLGMQTTFIERDDYARLAEFDALFIRVTTSVNHYTYRFARRAAAEGIVVIDDPESIERCTNKVYQAELFRRHSIPTPKTVLVHKGNARTVGQELGYPVVLKQPDSSFSLGVERAHDEEELAALLKKLLARSELVVAQQFVPSAFDWRVGVLDGQPLYVCKYYMARGHWQIQITSEETKRSYGRFETMFPEQAPSNVVDLALRAASHIGHGLYGVDLKSVNGQAMVIEINDNPSIDAGTEDAASKEALYDTIMRSFYRRLERRGQAW
jgi:glutathione synthase/RimK-type ligase-like ATP-grasp enzyme